MNTCATPRSSCPIAQEDERLLLAKARFIGVYILATLRRLFARVPTLSLLSVGSRDLSLVRHLFYLNCSLQAKDEQGAWWQY